MKLIMNAIRKIQHARFICTKGKNKLQKMYKYKNIETLQKARQFASCYVYKKLDTLRYAICHEILKLTFMYKKYDTLRYVTFLFKKTDTS